MVFGTTISYLCRVMARTLSIRYLVLSCLFFVVGMTALHGQAKVGQDSIIQIFTDGKKEGIWGVARSSCAMFKLNKDQKKQGQSSLYMEWDVTDGPCATAKMGFRFTSLNLLPKLSTHALSFYVKTDLPEMQELPLGFVLEDGYRDFTRAKFNAVGLMGQKLSEEWVKAYVPLRNFDFVKSGGDPTDIEQLFFEFERYGEIYLDDIKIEPFTDPFSKPKEEKPEEEVAEELVELPRTLFEDKLKHGWGIGTPYCSNFTISDKEFFEGTHAIQLDMQNYPAVCDWNEFGFSWSAWELVDLSKIQGISVLQMNLKSIKKPYELDIKVGFEDYDGTRTMINISNSYLESGQITEDWQLVRIPMSLFNFTRRGVDSSEIKQIIFEVGDDMHCFVDNIEILEFHGTSDRPFGTE